MRRIKILKRICLVAFAIIATRLFFIQIIEHDAWTAKANEQHTMLETIVAKRGEIYMMDGGEPVPVVLNQTVYSIIIDPAVTDREKLTAALNTYAKDNITADLDEVFSVEGLRYYIVARNVPHTTAEKIAEEGIAGVWFQKTVERVYPEGEMASGMLGFVNADGLGQYGVEGSLNGILKGKDGLLKSISDVNNVALSIGDDNIRTPAEDGKSVVLSIDRGLERGVEEITAAALANSAKATNAAVLIMNPETGEVLTMANLPNYDPGNYGQVKDASAYTNYTTEIPYEPASVCKTFAFSAAINENKMTADTTFFNNHYDIVDDNQIWNADRSSGRYGENTMKSAFYWSLNTGSMQALRLLGDDPENINTKGRETLYDYYYNKFGLGRATGIELIEAEGYLIEPHAEIYGLDATYANMTFGQNLGITMIQTAAAFSAVVNGGKYNTPTVVKGTYENGEIKKLDSTDARHEQILKSETSSAMRDMLQNNRYTNYKLPAGYEVGGKTGTAQTIKDGVYVLDETVGSYVGYLATAGEMPSLVVMVKMWNPDGAYITGNDAMDLFDSLAPFIINQQKLKPGA